MRRRPLANLVHSDLSSTDKSPFHPTHFNNQTCAVNSEAHSPFCRRTDSSRQQAVLPFQQGEEASAPAARTCGGFPRREFALPKGRTLRPSFLRGLPTPSRFP